ncbi:MAG TPA: glycosyltransferase [Rhodanobacteraceae bacterium]|nr:glycosyltransferase [Rhodanobacteraceae bacterium]
MNGWRSGAAAILRFITYARRWRMVAAVYARLPAPWKVSVSRRLLRSAIGVDQIAEAESNMPPVAAPRRHLDPRFAGQGVNLCGHVRSEFGLGECVRLFARTFAEAGFPFSLLNFELPIPAGESDRSLDSWLSASAEHAASVYFINPDQMLRARDELTLQKRQGRYLIGYWFWELEHFPAPWIDALELVDEVWVASSFVQRAVSAVTQKPVMRMPLPVDLPSIKPDREKFGLGAGKFVFLFTFDYHSYRQRKNPEAVIAAFQAAFPLERDDVRLLIKTVNAERVADAHLRLVGAARGDPRIQFRDEHLRRDEMYRLIASADAYVSLHRSEGFGLGMAEAMYFGKPVVATRYSGNLDFMADDVACLVDCTMVEVPPEAYPHWRGQQWARPDLQHAATHMRRLADDPVASRALGAAAAARIRRQYAAPARGSAAISRLQAITVPRAAPAIPGTPRP